MTLPQPLMLGRSPAPVIKNCSTQRNQHVKSTPEALRRSPCTRHKKLFYAKESTREIDTGGTPISCGNYRSFFLKKLCQKRRGCILCYCKRQASRKTVGKYIIGKGEGKMRRKCFRGRNMLAFSLGLLVSRILPPCWLVIVIAVLLVITSFVTAWCKC